MLGILSVFLGMGFLVFRKNGAFFLPRVMCFKFRAGKIKAHEDLEAVTPSPEP